MIKPSRGTSTKLFFDDMGNYITPVVGYLNPSQIEIYLKLVHLKDYEFIKSQEDFTAYIKNFKGQFKGITTRSSSAVKPCVSCSRSCHK